MPIKGGEMTAKERVFIERYVATGNARYAALQAGYAAPGVDASRALARPEIMKEIRQRSEQRLVEEALPLAVERVIGILQDKKSSERGVIQAAKLTFDRTLGEAASSLNAKEPHEMTPAEIDARLAELQSIAAERAKPVIQGELAEPVESGVFD